MKKSLLLLTTLLLIASMLQAQVTYVKTNIFHKIKPPIQLMQEGKMPQVFTVHRGQPDRLAYGVASYPDIASFRIIGPAAGYGVLNNNLVAGVGYGYNRLHYVDSVNSYHSLFSINAMLWGAAQLGVPSLNPNNKNVIGIGPSIGLFNNILILGYCWKAPFVAGTSGESDLIIAGHLPIN